MRPMRRCRLSAANLPSSATSAMNTAPPAAKAIAMLESAGASISIPRATTSRRFGPSCTARAKPRELAPVRVATSPR